MNGELVVVDDVAAAFCDLILEHLAVEGSSRVIALSGGGTARRCYEQLASRTDPTLWSSVDVVWGDERCVPLDDPDSNHALAAEALGESLAAARSVHPMRCDRGAAAYAGILDSLGGPGIIHLGLGPDGHTASLFPGAESLRATEDVVLTADPLGLNPHPRMSLTFPAIARAELVIVTVEGAAKLDAMRRVLDGDPSAPASLLSARRLVWLVDQAALGRSSPR